MRKLTLTFMNDDVKSSIGEWVRDLDSEPFDCFLSAEEKRVVSVPLEVIGEDNDLFKDDLKLAQDDPTNTLVSPESWHEGDDSLLVVFPYVEGNSLRQWHSSKGAECDAEDVILQMARTVKSLSERGLTVLGSGVIEQTLVTEDQKVFVQDAGLYFPLRNTLSGQQERHAFLAPEYGLQDSKARLDVYCLGRLLIYLHTSDSQAVIEYDDANQQWIDAENNSSTKLLEKVPRELHGCLAKSLAKNPDNRFETVNDFITEVESVRRIFPGHAIPASESRTEEDGRETEARKMRRVGVVLTLLALLAPPVMALTAAVIISSTRNRDVPNAFDSSDLRTAQIASQPGDDGEWWLDDPTYYWLLPPLRESLTRKERNGDFRDKVNMQELLSNPKNSEVSIEGYAEHLDALNPSNHRGISSKKLEWLLKKTPSDSKPTTVHLRAVLMHKLATDTDDLPKTDKVRFLEQAVNEYKDALDRYEWHSPGLKALCQSDYARLLASDGNRDGANEQLDEALDLIKSSYFSKSESLATTTKLDKDQREHIGPFVVDLLCRQGALYRRDGAWEKAQEKLSGALELLGSDVADQLRAHVLERNAWYHMDRWEVGDAEDNFDKARQIRKKNKQKIVFEFHNRHGSAMAKRYQGRDEEASKQYATMIDELTDAIKESRKSPGDQRTLKLEARLLESCQRYGDCYLYGKVPIDDKERLKKSLKQYDEALHELRRQHLLRETNSETFAKIKFRKALAHALLALAEDKTLEREKRLKAARKEFREADNLMLGETNLIGVSTRASRLRGSGFDEQNTNQLLSIPRNLKEAFTWSGEPQLRNPDPSIVGKQHVLVADATIDARYSNQRLRFLRNLVEAFISFANADDTSEASRFENLLATIREEFVILEKGQKASRDELDALLVIARQLANNNELHGELNQQLGNFPNGRYKDEDNPLKDYLRRTYDFVDQTKVEAHRSVLEAGQ
jgi:serine/threonine protein kinase